MRRAMIALTLVVIGLMIARLVIPPRPEDVPAPEVRVQTPRTLPWQPVALALARQGDWLYVAGRQSGSIAVVDTVTLRVAAEVPVGRRLADLALTPDGLRLLAVDEAAGELIVLQPRGSELLIMCRQSVGPGPVSLAITADGARCAVASLWSRRLTILNLAPQEKVKDPPPVVATLTLPFAPRLLLPLRDSPRLLVTDSFGGQLAVVDLEQSKIESVRPLAAHNIRGLALSSDGQRVLVAHQTLSSLVTTSRDDVHWGNLINNCLRELALASVLDPQADLMQGSRLHHLGEPGRGAGDPAGVAVLPSGKIAVALAGVGELAIADTQAENWQRMAVGRRPTVVAVGAQARSLYVADTSDDSITVIDLDSNKVRSELRLCPPADRDPAERGEQLFYDARLSHDGWFSCHSCHTDGHSNGLLADILVAGEYGSPRRVLSLLGTRDTGPWAWNGSNHELEMQVRKSVETTLQGVKFTTAQSMELTAFVRNLATVPGLGRFDPHAAEAVRRGEVLFRRHQCDRCHVPPAYTSTKTYSVPRGDTGDGPALSPPSLRGVSHGGPYFHDGRAATLRDVLTRERHQLRSDLSPQEVEDLLALLRDL
jgi:YVTN family beta-propeller protein